MSARPQLIAFDLDDTLGESKTAIDPAMADALTRLLSHTQVCIITGGAYTQITSQVLHQLTDTTEAALAGLHLMPTCGTQYYRRRHGTWHQQYSNDLTPEQKASATTALQRHAERLGYWEPQPWGPIIEDRGTQITYSALGQQAPVEAKKLWDPTGHKKNTLRDALTTELPTLEVRSGGSTSIDITHRGIDKAYGITQLSQHTGIPLGGIQFVGDRLDPGGNDHPVTTLGITCHPVTDWRDTLELVTGWNKAAPDGGGLCSVHNMAMISTTANATVRHSWCPHCAAA